MCQPLLCASGAQPRPRARVWVVSPPTAILCCWGLFTGVNSLAVLTCPVSAQRPVSGWLKQQKFIFSKFWRLPFLLLGSQSYWIGFPHGSMTKYLPAKAGNAGLIPAVGKIPCSRKWQPIPVFLLRSSMGSGARWAIYSMGSQRVNHDWARTHACILN